MKKILIVIMCCSLIGCVTASQSVGSKNWYNAQLDELRQAHLNGQISTEKYLELRSDADKLRREYVRDRDRYFERHSSHAYYCPRYGYGYGYHRGPRHRHW